MMGSEVMASRIVGGNSAWGRNQSDFYPTPPEATQALLDFLKLEPGTRIWEPACGEGHMVEVMEKNGLNVIGTDIRRGRMAELISRSALKDALKYWTHFPEHRGGKSVYDIIDDAPAVDAVEVSAQELQFLIDAMYRHIRWMIAGRLDKPECSFNERVALSEKLRLFEREHFPDMQAETEG